jgi:hypothetical protein
MNIQNNYLIGRRLSSLILFYALFFNMNFRAEAAQSTDSITAFPKPERMIDQSEQRQVPAVEIVWNVAEPDIAGLFRYEATVPQGFSFLGIGWILDSTEIDVEQVEIKYRTRRSGADWGTWIELHHEPGHANSKTSVLWSDILFVPDTLAHQQVQIEVNPLRNGILKSVHLHAVNMLEETPVQKSVELETPEIGEPAACPRPTLVTRNGWCGGYTACYTPSYTPAVINATHVVIHHGASPDTYADGHAIVRSYWNYHVYTNGWDDVGYNYLIDKFGNIFQGRLNASPETQDVKGAHAGSSNGKSIGICFLGNADVTQATDIQLQRLNELLAWWFQSRGYDPTSKALILNQAGSEQLFLPRIIGHRDVRPTTECPGNHLHTLLPTIGQSAKEQQIACSGNAPTADIALIQLQLSKTSVKSGDSVEIQLTYEMNSASKDVEISLWASEKANFNPTFATPFHSFKLNKSELNTYTGTIVLPKSLKTGPLYLHAIADCYNQLYETDETNNEVTASLQATAQEYQVQIAVHPTGAGIVKGAGKYESGQTITTVATAHYSYRISYWENNGVTVSNDSIYQFTMDGDVNLTAHFDCMSNLEPIAISGPTKLCWGESGIAYSVPHVPLAKYTWTFPEGLSGTSTTNKVYVLAHASFDEDVISVEVQGACTQQKANITVQVYPDPEPPIISEVNGMLRTQLALEHQWYLNDSLLEGNTGQMLWARENGNYTAIVSNAACTSNISKPFVWNSNDVGNLETVVAFPNPTSGIVELVTDQPLNRQSKIQVYTLQGQKVQTLTNLDKMRHVIIDLNTQPKGLYLIEVKGRTKTKTVKVLKE